MIEAPELEPLFSYSADIEEPQQGIGTGPFGHRMIAHVTGGRVHGPRLNGKVLPGGSDWALIDDQNTMVAVDVGNISPDGVSYDVFGVR